MRLLLGFCTTLVLLSVPSCGGLQVPVRIHDEDLYFLKQVDEPRWAAHMHFLTEGTEQVSRTQWDAISQGMVCMPSHAFEDFNAEIGKLCSQVKCDYETLQQFQRLVGRIHSLQQSQE